jgi:hypothetical protein
MAAVLVGFVLVVVLDAVDPDADVVLPVTVATAAGDAVTVFP